jgi:hypothetical protein
MVRRAKLTLNATAQAADLPLALRYTRFRSQLEIAFALQLETHGVRWFYEPEARSWVEVKGCLSTRDYVLLREVAAFLAEERKQRLFMYTARRAYIVSSGDFSALTHADFWQILLTGGAERAPQAE